MRIKLPSGKNISESQIVDYQNHIKKILDQKVTLEKSIQNKKLAINDQKNLNRSTLN